MQVDRIPTREEIRARNIALGKATPPPVVPIERVRGRDWYEDQREREREQRAVEELRRAAEDAAAAEMVARLSAEALAATIERALSAASALTERGSTPAANIILSDVARWIVRDEASLNGVDRSDIMSSRHSRPVVLAKHRAMYRVKKITNWSLPHIGRFFGNRDHTTVLHAVRKIERLVAAGAIADPAMRDQGANDCADSAAQDAGGGE